MTTDTIRNGLGAPLGVVEAAPGAPSLGAGPVIVRRWADRETPWRSLVVADLAAARQYLLRPHLRCGACGTTWDDARDGCPACGFDEWADAACNACGVEFVPDAHVRDICAVCGGVNIPGGPELGGSKHAEDGTPRDLAAG